MNNTTYTANENCFLIDGEVYLVDGQSLVNIKSVPVLSKVQRLIKWRIGSVEVWYLQNGNLAFRITHSTKPLDGIKPLPRDKFVKPKDVEALARRQSQIIGSNGKSRLVDLRFHFVMGFKAGHNANPNEFTREEMIKAMNSVHNNPLIILDIPAYINHLRPLSLPARLEINEQGEIVNVIWNES